MNPYANKSHGRPRHIYRETLAAVEAAAPGHRPGIMREMLEKMLDGMGKHDFRKMRYIVPAWLRGYLYPELIALENRLDAIARHRARRMKMVYPHASDEFSLEPDFLDSVFDLSPVPIFDTGSRIVTIGSCFARNIAEHLQARGYNATNFPLSEDLNAPTQNALMLEFMAADEQKRRDHIRYWVDAFGGREDGLTVDAVVAQEDARLMALADDLRQADVVVVTLGTALDFFLHRRMAYPVAPKYLLINPDHPEHADALQRAMKSAGAALRLGSHDEVKHAITAIHARLGLLTKATARVIFTVSPVPVEMALGVIGPYASAMEVDCISKSRIRSALAEHMQFPPTDPAARAISYFPSYEIVRWVGSMMPFPLFGKEDGAARHVSAPVLAAVFDSFIRKHAAPGDTEVVSRRGL